MASGLPGPARNSGDVTGENADVEAAREFYAGLGLEWGLRVPAWIEWSRGRSVLHQRLMWLRRGERHVHAAAPGVAVDLAAAADLEAVCAIDAAAFGGEASADAPWLAALLAAPDDVVAVAFARVDGRAAATGYAVLASGEAGRTAMLGGIAVLEEQRRRGVGAALSAWLVRRGFEAGAHLAHLSPDDDRAARLYARLGFTETAGHDVHVDL